MASMSAENGRTLELVGRVALHGDAERERLFFALWPTRKTAMALHALACRQAVRAGGRVTRMDSIHLTVAFLGDVPVGRIDALRAPPADLAAPGFAMVLDQVGHWVRNGIVWAGPSEVPPALSALHTRLSDWVVSLGITLDTRPFRPHVTLLRKAARGELAEFRKPVEWQVNEYALVRSGRRADGSRYETIARFPLKPLNPGDANPS
jgi:RNA 2',3'-cyclic 3'-phosphodiesterase